MELVLATSTHVLKLEEGLVARSCGLPEGLWRVGRLQLVRGLEGGGWSYVLEGEGGRVVFLRGEAFVMGRLYEGVQEKVVGDFLGTGERLVRLRLGFGELVLTDGEEELETGQAWPGGRGGRC